MNDLISRQVAIDAINGDIEFLNGILSNDDVVGSIRKEFEFGIEVLQSVVKTMIELPSDQPDHGWNEIMVICDNCGHAINVRRENCKVSAQPEPSDDFARGYNYAKREIALSGEYERAYERGKTDARKKGTWILLNSGWGKCSECGFSFWNVCDDDSWDRYCRKCGVRMVGVKNGQTDL